MSRRELTGEERRLWRRVARTVRSAKPLPAEEEPVAPAKTVVKAAKPSKSARSAPPAKSPPRGPKPLADRGGEKRVRRGRVEIAAKLDLHGHSQDSGRAALARFLSSAPAPSTVLVVTGKGRAGQDSVLRKRLPDWLASPEIRPLISGYAQAHPSHGGGGAFYIFVRRS